MISEIQLTNTVKTDNKKVDKRFKLFTRILFSIGVAGQWLFVLYIVAFYGGVVLTDSYEKVNEKLGHGIIEGDTMGNIALAVHIFLAAIIMFGGPLQFFAGIRKRFPTFHRWNGRIYFVTAFLVSAAGLYMNASRGAHGGFIMGTANGLNAILIMSFSVMAWRTAMQRNFSMHKKWALRAYLMVSGVWFFRIGYGLWILLTGFTALGANSDLNGPFDLFLGFGHSLVPLLILELYFWAKASTNPQLKKIATVSLAVLSVLLIAGIGMVAMIFWVPVF